MRAPTPPTRPWLDRPAPGPPLASVEAFCGPGGMALGLHEAGFDVRYAFDLDPAAVATARLNLGLPVEVRDARAVSAGELLERAGVVRGELPLLSGGPPCQGFSKQRRGARPDDARNALVSEFTRLVGALRPMLFLFENVAVFGQIRGQTLLREMRAALGDYALHPHFYNSADYGLAQTRQRFIVVGVRQDLGVHFAPPAPLAGPWLTVGDVLAGVPEPPRDYSEHPDFPNHQRARVTEPNIERFAHVPQGGGWLDIPEALRLPCHRRVDRKTGGWPDVYGRLRWDGQCPTITGGFDSFTRGRYGHPLSDRPLTPYEAARLQGFPHGWRFVGTRADIRAQIGNAVPPPLARALGLAIRAALVASADQSTTAQS